MGTLLEALAIALNDLASQKVRVATPNVVADGVVQKSLMSATKADFVEKFVIVVRHV